MLLFVFLFYATKEFTQNPLNTTKDELNLS